MFTQDVANLMPKLPIKVTLKYVHPVKKRDGDYHLHIPLVVGPRFQPAGAGVPPAAQSGPTTEAFGAWELEALPRYPPVSGLDIPDSIEEDRVSIHVSLDGGMPLRGVTSPTHAVAVKEISPQVAEIRLQKGRTIDNRDFVLSYRIAPDDESEAGLLAYRDERGGYFSLLIEPPAVPRDDQIRPREMVFVLDCSGSMSGLPIEASKAFMREALSRLRPRDTFRVIRFSDSATEFSRTPLAATPANVRAGIRYTDSLDGSGGTMMTSGIRQALDVPVPDGALRIVTFLTDGYIGNEHEVLSLITGSIGEARLFAFGVGAGVNRFLLEKMGQMGRGFTRYMDPTENVEEVAKELAERLDSPVLTDVRIDWGALGAADITPSRIPDLFAGQSVRVQGRFDRPGRHRVTVAGSVNGRAASLPIDIELPERSADGEAIAIVWARSAIEDLMDDLVSPLDWRESRLSEVEIQRDVTRLGLDFSLVTKWTAFVAVSEKVYNDHPEKLSKREVPLPMVEGVTELAYGERPRLTTIVAGSPAGGGFSGASTPEPATVAGLLVTAAAGVAALRRKRRKDGR
jgi:Ca-activated chloride channel family protein